jgi:hypothetical protein
MYGPLIAAAAILLIVAAIVLWRCDVDIARWWRTTSLYDQGYERARSSRRW